ncbi:MAG TPA: outer membrane beta-barrel protein [Myxococcaceae bacterium]|nr:outer membrane beta-barrel protein [Myxococcaceae bacterium]
MRLLPLTCAALLLIFGLLPAEASARPPLSLRLGYAAQISTDRAYDLVDDNDHLPLFRVGAGYRLPVPAGLLELEAGFLTGGSSASVYRQGTASLGLMGVELGAAYRLPLGPHVEPYAQAFVGYDWLTLKLEPFRQRVGRTSATGLLGVTFLVPTRPRTPGSSAFFVDVGAGYGFRPDARFDALEAEPPNPPEGEDVSVPQSSLRLGSLPLSGVVYRLQLGLRL